MPGILAQDLENMMVLASPTAATDTPAIATASMPDTTKSLAVYDNDGTVIGYVAIYPNTDLT